MSSGKRVNWSLFDDLLKQYLPSMTIVSWASRYAPDISTKAVGARARKLGIVPARYCPTEEHKKAISKAISKETPQMIQFVRDNIDIHSRQKLAKLIGLSQARLHDLMNRHNIKLSKEGHERAREASRSASLGKRPWNKDGHLTEETKAKISLAVSGEKNGQYGRGMTEEEKERWRKTYQSNRAHKIDFVVAETKSDT